VGGNRINRAFCHSGDSNTVTYRSHVRNKQLETSARSAEPGLITCWNPVGIFNTQPYASRMSINRPFPP